MKRNASNLDGFVVNSVKKRRTTLDSPDNNEIRTKKSKNEDLIIIDDNEFENDLTSSLAELPGYDNIDNSNLIDEEPVVNDKNLKKAIKKSQKKSKKPMKKSKKVLIIVLAILLVFSGIFFAISALWPNDSLDGNWWDVLKYQELKKDENGFSNVLIFGTAPNDYDGPLLADTVIVASFNQETKDIYMVSLPRDLWVKHECPNVVLNTTMGKLNETYRCALTDDDAEKAEETNASNVFRSKAGEITGLDIQYYVHMNWEAVIDVVDAIGGIDITIQSDDPRGIYDYYTGIKFAQGEVVHMDGELALAYARARGAGGGYGLEGSNFSREKHQQEIIKAVQEKALSSGILSNPVTLINMLQAFENNIRTNFSTSEIQTLASIAQDIDTSKIISMPLIDAENDINLVKNDNINGASVVVPVAGTYNYSEIHKYIKEIMSSDPVVKEKAVIDVLNGSEIIGLAGEKAELLEIEGYTTGNIDNAPAGNYEDVEIYQLTDKTATAESLKNFYGVSIKTELPFGYSTTSDFIIVFSAR